MKEQRDLIEARIDLETALSQLSQNERILILLWGSGYTQNELAEKLGVTQPAISQKIAAILEKLRGML